MALEIPGKIQAGIPHEIVTKDHSIHHEMSAARSAQKNLSKPRDEDIRNNIAILERTGLIFNKKLKFSINKEIDRIIVKVIDSSTDKVIKEIPPDEVQRLIARIKEAIGLLVDERI